MHAWKSIFKCDQLSTSLSRDISRFVNEGSRDLPRNDGWRTVLFSFRAAGQSVTNRWTMRNDIKFWRDTELVVVAKRETHESTRDRCPRSRGDGPRKRAKSIRSGREKVSSRTPVSFYFFFFLRFRDTTSKMRCLRGRRR